ncbi:MAG: fimbrillin family protein [Paraprevotella sp.]|nr:fimbrillin family protein [Paraprevotella sp.]
MKKSLFYFAVSALALSACTSEEVLDESSSVQRNAIGFQNVVSKQSRAGEFDGVDITAANLKHFSVFGYYTNPNTPTQAVLVFNNELVSKGQNEQGQTTWNYDNTRYWVPGANYCFYAYSCGDVKLNSNFGKFSMDTNQAQANDRVLKINGYVCDVTHQHDLLFASRENVKPETDETGQNVTAGADVAFKFAHILSKIDTKFSSDFAPEYTVEIKNIMASNIRNVGDYDPKKDWYNQKRQSIDGVDPYVMVQGETAIVAQKGGTVTAVDGTTTVIEKKEPTSSFAFVLPHTYTSADVTLSFEIAVKKDDKLILSRVLSGSWKPTWVTGHWYTYTIQITGDAANLTPIMFTTETDPITGWTSGETPSDIVFSAN